MLQPGGNLGQFHPGLGAGKCEPHQLIVWHLQSKAIQPQKNPRRGKGGTLVAINKWMIAD